MFNTDVRPAPKRLGPRSNLAPYFFKSKLKEDRKWTDGLIRDFLGEPDAERPNFHYRTGPLQQLYLKSRVESIEATDEFQLAFAKLEKRRASARTVARRIAKERRERALNEARSFDFCVPKLDTAKLIEEACRHYNDRSFGERLATPDSSPEFLDRISVNYLRHECTAYDEILDMFKGVVGGAEAKIEARNVVLSQIADTYPDLNFECYRQQLESYERSLDLPW